MKQKTVFSKTRMSIYSSSARNSERVVGSTGYVFRGNGIDADWQRKAMNLANVARSRDPVRLLQLADAGLIRGYTEYNSGATALIQCIRSFHYVDLLELPNLLQMVRVLLGNGANPFTHSRLYGGVLHAATQLGDIDLIRLILDSTFEGKNSVKAWKPYDFEIQTSQFKNEKYITKINL